MLNCWQWIASLVRHKITDGGETCFIRLAQRYVEHFPAVAALCISDWWWQCYYSAPVGEQCIAISLSVVSVRKHISRTTGPIFTKFVVHCVCRCPVNLWTWLGPALAVLWYVVYFGFMADVTFDRSGPYDNVWLVALRYQGRVWCLRMPCLATWDF